VLVGAMLPRDARMPPALFPPTPPPSPPPPPPASLASGAAAAAAPESPELRPGRLGPGLATPAVHVFGAEDSMLPHSRALAAWWAHGRSRQPLGQSTRSDSVHGGVQVTAANANDDDGATRALRAAASSRLHTVEVLHPGGHRFPSGPSAKAHYATICTAVRAHCRPAPHASEAGCAAPPAVAGSSFL
jgi:hypothetical protein